MAIQFAERFIQRGRSAVQTIEVLDGLKEGDKVILSDMSEWEKFDHVRIK